ncbi:hypothetical protein OG272_21205 [Streptomyces sp. NBC_00104]|uniref:hypothetical protein n=1 Tax=Streptomyces sp. NBC_00104 TaxID=2903621 RepID=UPI003254CDEF
MITASASTRGDDSVDPAVIGGMVTVLCNNVEVIILAQGGEIVAAIPAAGPATGLSPTRISSCLHLRSKTDRFTLV